MASVEDNIKAIYELLPSKDKKGKTENEFREEFVEKMNGFMKSYGIPPAAFSKTVSQVRKNLKDQELSADVSIESIITSALSPKEITILTESVAKKTPSAVEQVAEAAVAAKIAEEFIAKDKKEDKSMSPEELHKAVEDYESLGYEGIQKVHLNIDKMNIEDLFVFIQKQKEALAKSDKLSPEQKDDAIENEDLVGAIIGRGRIDKKRNPTDKYFQKRIDEFLECPIDERSGLRIKTMIAEGIGLPEIVSEIDRIAKEIALAKSEYYSAINFEKRFEAPLIRYGYINPDIVQEEKGISKKEAEEYCKETYQRFAPDNLGEGWNNYSHSELFNTKEFLEKSLTTDEELGVELINNFYTIRERRELEVDNMGKNIEYVTEEGNSNYEYGIDSLIGVLDSSLDEKTIRGATKLFSEKIKELFDDKDAIENIKSMKTGQFKEWKKEQVNSMLEDESVSPEIKAIYQKLFELTFTDRKGILANDQSMSDYLKYISSGKLPGIIADGLKAKSQEKESIQEGPIPKKAVSKMQQFGLKPVSDFEVDDMFVVLGKNTIQGIRNPYNEPFSLKDKDEEFDKLFGPKVEIVQDYEIAEKPSIGDELASDKFNEIEQREEPVSKTVNPILGRAAKVVDISEAMKNEKLIMDDGHPKEKQEKDKKEDEMAEPQIKAKTEDFVRGPEKAENAENGENFAKETTPFSSKEFEENIPEERMGDELSTPVPDDKSIQPAGRRSFLAELKRIMGQIKEKFVGEAIIEETKDIAEDSKHVEDKDITKENKNTEKGKNEENKEGPDDDAPKL